MVRTTVFRNNRTQAVRLPKDVALPDDVKTVEVIAVGSSRVISPAGASVDLWFEHGTRVTEDFLSSREQGEQERADW